MIDDRMFIQEVSPEYQSHLHEENAQLRAQNQVLKAQLNCLMDISKSFIDQIRKACDLTENALRGV